MKQPETPLRGSENARIERIHILVWEASEAVKTARKRLDRVAAAAGGRKNEGTRLVKAKTNA